MDMNKVPSGSGWRYRTFLLVFGYTDGFWGKYLKGYTHVTLFELLPEKVYIGIDFGRHWCPMNTFVDLPEFFYQNYKCIQIRVRLNRGEHMFKFVPLQTCATLVQTICGFNVGAVFANTLYTRLSLKDDAWLEKRGITKRELF